MSCVLIGKSPKLRYRARMWLALPHWFFRNGSWCRFPLKPIHFFMAIFGCFWYQLPQPKKIFPQGMQLFASARLRTPKLAWINSDSPPAVSCRLWDHGITIFSRGSISDGTEIKYQHLHRLRKLRFGNRAKITKSVHFQATASCTVHIHRGVRDERIWTAIARVNLRIARVNLRGILQHG